MRTLIVDDEPLARAGMRAALAAHSDIEIVGECADGPSAVAAIRTLAPGLILLDVQMPGLDGFAVLEQVGLDKLPPVIFITAHDNYAVRAFDSCAVDYLLKPYSDERLARALDRVRKGARAEREPAADLLADLIRAYRERGNAGATRKRLLARDGERIVFVRTEDVSWLEADGNHVRVHAKGGIYTLRATLSGTLEQLDPTRFVRTHRSAAVNLDCVRELQSWLGGDGVAVLDNGEQVRVSRQYREELLRRSR